MTIIWFFSRNSANQKGMPGYILSDEREKPTTNITLPTMVLIQIWPRNQKHYSQAKAKRIRHHQIHLTTNEKGTSLGETHKRNKKTYKNKPKTIKKMVIRTYISIITLNINGLNAPTKRHRLAEWTQKQDLYIWGLQETHFRPRDTYRLKVRGWKKIFCANGNQNHWSCNITSDKINFKINIITRDKEGHYIMIKGSLQEEDITIVNSCVPNIGGPQYIRQMLTTMKGEIDNNTVIVGDVNTPLTPMDGSSRQTIDKETQALNDTLEQRDLIDIYRTLHPKAAEYTYFFSSTHGTFSRVDHILGHKSSLSNFNKTEIMASIFSGHNAMRLEINYREKKTIKYTNTWRVNNVLLNNQEITEDIKEEIKEKNT